MNTGIWYCMNTGIWYCVTIQFHKLPVSGVMGTVSLRETLRASLWTDLEVHQALAPDEAVWSVARQAELRSSPPGAGN